MNKKKKPKAPVKLKYSYLDIGLTPVLTFDYLTYKEVIFYYISRTGVDTVAVVMLNRLSKDLGE